MQDVGAGCFFRHQPRGQFASCQLRGKRMASGRSGGKARVVHCQDSGGARIDLCELVDCQGKGRRPGRAGIG